jgi:hypothetical protein
LVDDTLDEVLSLPEPEPDELMTDVLAPAADG